MVQIVVLKNGVGSFSSKQDNLHLHSPIDRTTALTFDFIISKS